MLHSILGNHSLNLAANDTIKIIKIIKEALGIAYEIIKLIKKSPKRTGKKYTQY